MLYSHIVRPLLFRLTQHDAEQAHERAMVLLATVSRSPMLLRFLHRSFVVQHPTLECTLFGVRFPNPVGLAGGFDKHGRALPALAALGFGFLEVGTVTWHTQHGNPRPRLFRLPADEALVNRMGFNNDGAQAMAQQLQTLPVLRVPVGISLGKSRITPPDEAIDDYCASLRVLAPHADYIAINVSSPNTPGLKVLHERHHLQRLLAALQQEARQIAKQDASPVPLLVKIAPDLSQHAIGEVLDVCAEHRVSGIIATNTLPVGKISSAGTRTPSGGLSGRPLKHITCQTVRFIADETGGHLPIIGVGGVACADDAQRLFDAGASLVQLYTGFIYQGPGLIRDINRRLSCSFLAIM